MADGLNEVADALGFTFDVIGYSDMDEALGGIGLNNGFRHAAALYLDWVQLASFMDPDMMTLLTDNSLLGPMGRGNHYLRNGLELQFLGMWRKCSIFRQSINNSV